MKAGSRLLGGSIVLLVLAGCGTGRYFDTSARVDARPECAGSHGQDPSVAPWCERKTGVDYTIGGDSEPVDFTPEDDER